MLHMLSSFPVSLGPCKATGANKPGPLRVQSSYLSLNLLQWYIFSEEDYLESEFEYKSNPTLENYSDNNKIVIQHLTSTSRELVGLQVRCSKYIFI